jgi:hypothetical protein
MNELQSPAELSDQIAALRFQQFIALLALVIVSASLAGYLYVQQRFTRRDIGAIKPQAVLVIQDFNQNRSAITNFIQQLVTYGQAHPDFQQQVLKKYGITPQTLAAPKK